MSTIDNGPLSERESFDFGLDHGFYRRVLDGMPGPIVVVDGDGIVRYGNFAAIELTRTTFEDGVGRHILEFVHPDEHKWIAETFLTLVGMTDSSSMLGDETWNAIRFRLLTTEGEEIPVEVTGKVALGDEDVDGIALVIRDMRLESTSQRVLHGIANGDDLDTLIEELTTAITHPPLDLQAAAFRSAENGDPQLVATSDPLLTQLDLNDESFVRMIAKAETVTRVPADQVPAIGIELVAAGYTEFLHTSATSPDGAITVRLVAASPHFVAPALGSIQRLQWAQELMSIVLLRDHADRLLERAAAVDPLTGLANRRGLRDFLQEYPSDEPCAMLYIDIDDFKSINDRFGHARGDQALVIVGDRLRRAVRLGDHISRLGGDEFVAIVTDLGEQEPFRAAEAVAERILRSLVHPLRLESATISLSASVGIAIPNLPLDVDDLLDRADRAMYDAKRAGGGRYAVRDRRA